MKHSHTRIWIHLIWAVKNRERCLFADAGQQLYKHLLMRAKDEIRVPFEQLHIQPEHVHGLIDLPTDICLADFMKKIKGESSHWINQSKLIKEHFSWQRGFGAYSVSASQLQIVKSYIQNQSQHHKQKTFTEEYNDWKQQYGIIDD